MWYLWENTAIFQKFIDGFLIKECEIAFSKGLSREADKLLYMAVHNMFIEPTNQHQDWRVVEISQRLIQHEVNKASSIRELKESKLLSGWMKQLRKTSEARRCIHYMFKQKCQRIDFNYLSNLNMMRIYERCQQKEVGTPDDSRSSQRSEGGSFDASAQLGNSGSSDGRMKNPS